MKENPAEEHKRKKNNEKEEAARERQVYDSLRKSYDERRRRVTDLVECTRVVLPKPRDRDKEKHTRPDLPEGEHK